MSRSTPPLSDQLELLETRVRELGALCQRLRLENRSLREQQASLVEERARLIDKNEQARTKVELMIQRLKAMETST